MACNRPGMEPNPEAPYVQRKDTLHTVRLQAYSCQPSTHATAKPRPKHTPSLRLCQLVACQWGCGKQPHTHMLLAPSKMVGAYTHLAAVTAAGWLLRSSKPSDLYLWP